MSPPNYKTRPRNYFFVPASTVVDRQRVGHDAVGAEGKLTGAIELEIKTLGPVFVGSGNFVLADGKMAKMPVESLGRMVIPGTSIKGTCRQLHEAITCSDGPWSSEPETSDRSEERTETGPLSRAVDWSSSLFGKLGYRGRMSFDDADAQRRLERHRIHVSAAYPPVIYSGRRFYGEMPKGAKQCPINRILCFPPGTKMRTVLRFVEVEESDLGSVLVALGLGGDSFGFTPKLGGGKYDPIGWVRFHALNIHLRAPVFGIEEPETRTSESSAAFLKRIIDGAIEDLPQVGRIALSQLVSKLQCPLSEGEVRR